MGRAVINARFGVFGLSEIAEQRYLALSGKTKEGFEKESEYGYFLPRKSLRHDHALLQVVEELGEDASDCFCNLKIEVFEGNRYRIDECEGKEWLETPDTIEWIEIEENNR